MKFLRIVSILVNAILLVLGVSVCLGVSFFRAGTPVEEDTGLSVFSFVTCFLLFLIVANEIISMLRIGDSTHHTVLVSGALMLYAFASPDALVLYSSRGLEGSLGASEVVTTLSFFGGVLAILYFASYTYGLKGKKLPMLPMLIVAGVCLALYLGLSFISLQIVAYAIFVACSIGYYIYVFLACSKAKIDDPTFHFSSYILFALLGMHGVNVLHYSGYIGNVNWWSTAYLWAIMLAFILIYLRFALVTSTRADKLQAQAENLRANAFMGQYRPNFINSSFSAIEQAYHHSLEDGDKALHLFSQYMNDSSWMFDKGLVSFEKECEFLTNYIAFCNIGSENPIELEFNISYSDFVVPSLSLQPYVENAVTLSKKNDKIGHKITISATREGDYVMLTVFDKGTGANLKVAKFGTGISNSRERFKILLKAESEVKRNADGIVVSIKIPHAQKEEKPSSSDQ